MIRRRVEPSLGSERTAKLPLGGIEADVLLAVSPHIVIVGIAALVPDRSKALLDRALKWLQDHNRVIMIGLGAVFGVF
jgi:hypothetical protein